MFAHAEATSLAGNWRFELDRLNHGVNESWFSRRLNDRIELPGSLPERGIGDAVGVDTKWTGSIFNRSYFTSADFAPYRQPGNIKVPFWLQPETYYVGVAWFQRDIILSKEDVGRHLTVSLERPHWKTSLWLDAAMIGTCNSLSVPHVYDLGTGLSTGHHVLSIRVDNTLDPDIGENSHSISDHTQGNWNGIVGNISLIAQAPVWIENLEVFPRLKDRVAVVRGRLLAIESRALPTRVTLSGGKDGEDSLPYLEVDVDREGRFAAEYAFGPSAELWDEFHPTLHHIVAQLENGEKRSVVFGFRELTHDGRKLNANGRRLFLRGTLDCAAYPETGHPPLDRASWLRTFQVIKAHGLNHVRFHSWCPPDAAFAAADELGLYLQIEVASWPNQSTTLGDGKPVDAWIDAETDRILRQYGSHPSFAFLCACNEPGGAAPEKWLAGWVARQKARDARRFYTAGAGWPELPENDYNIRSEPRIQHWTEGLGSRINKFPPETASDYCDFIDARSVPVVSHEIGQWCAYPNFSEISKYHGYLKPKNFEIFRRSLAQHHMLDQAHDFLIASGKLQAECYKEDIESTLRTPEMGGFQLLGLSDFPGQGTALVGVLDAFWEDKGYITSNEFRRFCNSTVPLLRLDRRVFTGDEALTASVEVAHFGSENLPHAQVSWKLISSEDRIEAKGQFDPADIVIGETNNLGRINLSLSSLPAPARYKIVVAIDGTPFANDWDIWVYDPPSRMNPDPAPDVLVVHQLDAAAQARLQAGGKVVLMIPPERVQPDPTRGKIALGFSSIFWNTAWTNGQAPHTLGLLCNPEDPLFKLFPTYSYSSWQWWYPLHHASAMIMDSLPTELRPSLQIVDDWFTNRKLGLIFEARVATGRLLVTSIDLNGENIDPVRRQLRASIFRYVASSDFDPKVTVQAQEVNRLIVP